MIAKWAMTEFKMCFVYSSREALDKALAIEMSGADGCHEWMQALQAEDQFVGGNALSSAGVRITGKDRTVSDRAGSEIKELVGCYFIIKAQDLEEATKMAQDHYWEFERGTVVEIREVRVFENR